MTKDVDTEYEFAMQTSLDFIKLIDEFCVSLQVEKNSSAHTIRNYKNDLITYVMWADDMGLDAQKVTYRQLRNYLAEMNTAQYARTTINRKLSSLRSFFRWLELTRGVSNNFADIMKAPKIHKSLPHMVIHSDIDKILKQCKLDIDQAEDEKLKAAAYRDYTIIEVLYATGARISEVSALKISNINLHSAQIKFFGKGQKERIVPVYNIALVALDEYLNCYRKLLVNKKNSLDIRDVCFLGNRGGAMSADSMRKMFYKKCDTAGISSKVSPHSIRHSFASDVLDGGADLRSVQEMLGHASLSTTQIYTHLSAKKLKDTHSLAHPRG